MNNKKLIVTNTNKSKGLWIIFSPICETLKFFHTSAPKPAGETQEAAIS